MDVFQMFIRLSILSHFSLEDPYTSSPMEMVMKGTTYLFYGFYETNKIISVS